MELDEEGLPVFTAAPSTPSKGDRELYITQTGQPSRSPVDKKVGSTPKPLQKELITAIIALADNGGISFPELFAEMPSVAPKFIGIKFGEAEKKLRLWLRQYNAVAVQRKQVHFKHTFGSYIINFKTKWNICPFLYYNPVFYS